MHPALRHFYYSSSRGGYSDLISYWNFDEYSIDYANNYGNHATNFNTPTQVSGKIGNAWQFNGTNEYMVIPHHDSLSFTSGGGVDLPFSWAFWINPSSLAAINVLLCKRGPNVGSAHEYQVQIETSGAIRVTLFSENNSAVSLRVTSNGTISTDEFSHIAVTYDGSKTAAGIKIYINAVLQTNTDSSPGTYVGMTNAGADLTVCKMTNDTLWFAGILDEMALFSVALDQDRIDRIYNNGDGLAYSYNSNALAFDIQQSDYNILATRDNYQLATDGTDLYWSNNCGETYINQYTWGQQFTTIPVYNKYIDFAYIFSDGTVIFACGPLMFRSTDKLQTVNAVTAYLEDGVTPYPIHTPATTSRPGTYFHQVYMDHQHHSDDIYAWVNYGNVEYMGACPVTVWYTADKGATIKAAYRFGQNTNYRDDGTENGGTTGTLLGDSGNAIIAKHGHAMVRKPGTYEWYFTTGDETDEVHWFKGVYDPQNDTWAFTQLVDGADPATRFKAGGIQLAGENVYWAADATGTPAASELGLFRCPIVDIDGVTSERVFAVSQKEAAYININTETDFGILILGGTNAFATEIILIENVTSGVGRSWIFKVQDAVAGFGGNRLGKPWPKDANGYARVAIGRIQEEVLGTVRIKF